MRNNIAVATIAFPGDGTQIFTFPSFPLPSLPILHPQPLPCLPIPILHFPATPSFCPPSPPLICLSLPPVASPPTINLAISLPTVLTTTATFYRDGILHHYPHSPSFMSSLITVLPHLYPRHLSLPRPPSLPHTLTLALVLFTFHV